MSRAYLQGLRDAINEVNHKNDGSIIVKQILVNLENLYMEAKRELVINDKTR